MREERLRELTQIVSQTALLIRHRALPMKELFHELSRFDFIRKVREFGGTDFRNDWLTAADELLELQEEERGVVKSIGMFLGSSDVEGQLSMLEINSALLKQYGDEAHEQYLKKGKMYRTFGLLSGILAAILIM